VRRAAAFAEAVYAERVTVENVTAVRVEASSEEALRVVDTGDESHSTGPLVAIMVDPDGSQIPGLSPDVIVDARMAKRNLGTKRSDAALTVGLGPGFEAGSDVDVVVETQRGPSMGRLIEQGAAIADTGVPGNVAGFTKDRLIRSPANGVFRALAAIGDIVSAGQIVGEVARVPVKASLAGLLRGLVADGLTVVAGEKLGDVDPRGDSIDPSRISDKSGVIGRSVLTALVSRGLCGDDGGN
jgi:xanthine dehydrogenase accessory factor